LVVMLIALIAGTRVWYLATLVPLFPTFTMIALYAVGTSRSPSEFKSAIVFALWSVIPYICYLISVYHLAGRVSIPIALGLSIVVWSVAAVILVGLSGR
jgi:membrane protein GlpM